MSLKKLFDLLRMGVIALTLIIFAVAAGVGLMKIQVVDGEKYLAMSKSSSTATQLVFAPRGEIVDSNGISLVENRAGYNIIIEYSFFPKDKQEQNRIILELAKLLEADGIRWLDSLPITREQPYSYTDDIESSDVKRVLSKLRLNDYATAENCIDKLVENYEISSEYTRDEQRIIAGIRYEMILADFSSKTDYVVVKDVPIETVTKVKELSHSLYGVDIAEDAVRIYSSGSIFPHGIGYVGPIYAEEYEKLKDEGYLLTDTIGKSGIEKAMEDELRGEYGEKTITVTSDGEVSKEITQEAQPGNTVKLTIDSEFQLKVQNILQEHIDALANKVLTKTDSRTHEEYDFTDAQAGAIVVMDVKTGGILAMASAPGYDLNEMLEDYSAVLNTEGNPLYNRATDGLYRPGSVMKTITAIAALSEGIITPDSLYNCNREYNFIDIIVNCTGRHGNIGVVKAIEKSCNIFFYQVIQELGLDKFMEYQTAFGLGQSSDMELSSAKGYLASPETFRRLNMDWTVGQVLQAAIGQSEVAVTPLQMVSIAQTIASKGTRYTPYLVDSVWDYSMTECLDKTQPTVAGVVNAPESVFDTVIEGMIDAAENSTSSTYYETNEEAKYLSQFCLNVLPEKTAIKTGTPQAYNKATQNSTAVGFYPADDPEIAFAIVVENGEYSKYMVRKIIDAYYCYENVTVDRGNGIYETVIKGYENY